MKVALRKESVDRNDSATPEGQLVMKSLSARRAWIEMLLKPRIANIKHGKVALRKESVDRNIVHAAQKCVAVVALRKESVDRN